MKNKYLFLFAVFLCFLVLIITARILLVPKQAEIPWMLSRSPHAKMTTSLREIFNESKGNEWISGICHVDYDMVLTYHFKPPATGSWEDSLGMNLSPKIKAFYEKFQNNDSIQNLIISIRVPLEVYPGSIDWVPVVSFEFDRDLYKRTDWKNFKAARLLKYSRNVQWSDLASF